MRSQGADRIIHHLPWQYQPLFAEGKDWHGMRRFRLRRLWRVNCEALMRAAGQNLKRLLKRRGWGRRPCPAEAMYAPLIGYFCVVYSSFFGIHVYFLDDLLRILDGWEKGHAILLMSFVGTFQHAGFLCDAERLGFSATMRPHRPQCTRAEPPIATTKNWAA